MHVTPGRFTYLGSSDGWLLRGVDLPEEQAYIQKHPYLDGPDEALNARLLLKTRENWTLVEIPPPHAMEVVALEESLFGLSENLVAERKRRPADDPLAWRPAFEAYAWKVNMIPMGADRILSIGCGSAAEIGAMRCMGRGLRIHAVDFRRGFSEEVCRRYDFQFECGSWLEYLRATRLSFDAAFSNHCMEHIYNDPTEVLRRVASVLVKGGAYVFAMPIERSASNPYARAFPRLLAPRIYPWMLDAVDCGHPWKTDLPEIAWRLREAGFSSVEFFFRGKGRPYSHVPTDPLFDLGFDKSWAQSVVADAKRGRPRTLSQAARRAAYRLKSALRLNHLKNERTHEVLVRAVK